MVLEVAFFLYTGETKGNHNNDWQQTKSVEPSLNNKWTCWVWEDSTNRYRFEFILRTWTCFASHEKHSTHKYRTYRFGSHLRPSLVNVHYYYYLSSVCKPFAFQLKLYAEFRIREGILEIIEIPLFRGNWIFLVNWPSLVGSVECSVLTVYWKNIFEIGIISSDSNCIHLNTNLICIKH